MKKTIGSVMVAAALGISASAHAFNVDLFAENAAIQDLTKDGAAVTAFQNEAAVGNIMGGQRDISVDYQSGNDADGISRVLMNINNDKLAFSNDDGVGGEGRVQWDGSADGGSMTLDKDGLGGINLWAFGAGFTVETLSADLGFPIAINAYTDDTHFTEVVISTTGPGVEFISFAALENAGLCGAVFGPILSVTCGAGGNVDMSNFGALEFVINIAGFSVPQTLAVDLSIGPITAVPEPTVLSLFGAGLLGAGALRRRKAKSAA